MNLKSSIKFCLIFCLVQSICQAQDSISYKRFSFGLIPYQFLTNVGGYCEYQSTQTYLPLSVEAVYHFPASWMKSAPAYTSFKDRFHYQGVQVKVMTGFQKNEKLNFKVGVIFGYQSYKNKVAALEGASPGSSYSVRFKQSAEMSLIGVCGQWEYRMAKRIKIMFGGSIGGVSANVHYHEILSGSSLNSVYQHFVGTSKTKGSYMFLLQGGVMIDLFSKIGP